MRALLIGRDGAVQMRDVRHYGAGNRNADILIDSVTPAAFNDDPTARSFANEPRRFAFVGETAYTRTLIYEER